MYTALMFTALMFTGLISTAPTLFSPCRLPAMAEDASHYVYIVRCSDGTLYTGYTTDVERRVAEHNAGAGAKYTRGRRPVRLVYKEAHATASEAMQREYAIKQLRRQTKERLLA